MDNYFFDNSGIGNLYLIQYRFRQIVDKLYRIRERKEVLINKEFPSVPYKVQIKNRWITFKRPKGDK